VLSSNEPGGCAAIGPDTTLSRQQLAELEKLINRAQSAQVFLAEALQCPADHPANECNNMVAALDRLPCRRTGRRAGQRL